MKCTDAIKFIFVTVTALQKSSTTSISGISHHINQPSPCTVGTTAIHTALLMALWKMMAHAQRGLKMNTLENINIYLHKNKLH